MIKISLYVSILICLILTVSCRNNDAESNYSKREQTLQESIRMKDLRIATLEDSLQKLSKNTTLTNPDPPAGINPDPPVNVIAASNTTIVNTAKEHSLYKKGKKRGKTISVEIQKKYPGEFPEASLRPLTESDLKFLSEWGLQVMLNEIYARHGMIFANETMQKHFNRSNWYHGKEANVEKQLSAVEKQNIIFIKNYKFKPDIPT